MREEMGEVRRDTVAFATECRAKSGNDTGIRCRNFQKTTKPR
jgi:hypothetical protein